MHLSRGQRLTGILILTVVLILALTSITPVKARPSESITLNFSVPTSGSGTAGSGFIAVAGFFSSTFPNNAGAFSGSLFQPVLGGLDTLGVFSLTSGVLLHQPLPAGILDLGCGSAGEVELVGIVTSTNTATLSLNNVQILGCVGTSSTVVAEWVIPYIGDVAYFGKGVGTVSVSVSSILTGLVLASSTSGSVGRAMFTAEASDVGFSGMLAGDSAFVGTLDGVQVGGVHTVETVSIQSSCTLVLSGVVTQGSFLGQLMTISAVPSTCPPPGFGSTAQWPVLTAVVIGPPTKLIYAGHGPGTERFCVPWGN